MFYKNSSYLSIKTKPQQSTITSLSDIHARRNMAQAYVEQQGYYLYIEFPIDEDHYLWIGRKKGQPKIGIFKKTKDGRKGPTFTPEQFQQLLDLTDSVQLALSLIEPK